ncbi:MAG TPA: isochorismatase family protein [Candidatus Stackebrandtia faecavium]|nr:isochorismatase family protein [Candidatus Stackebrandtia faecavium]
MTIPALREYPLPTQSQLPSPRVSWEFDPTRAALLIHDMQEYFLDFYGNGFEQLVDNVVKLRKLDVPVYYTAQPPKQTLESRGLLTDRWGPGLQDRDGIIDPLKPGADDVVLTKHRYSAFIRSDLAQRLADAGRDQLVICGVYAHIGITATAMDAFSLDIKPFVPADAIADFTQERHYAAMEHLAATCSYVTTVDDLVSNDPTLADVRAQICALLDEPVDDDDDLADAGLDSIKVMDLVGTWRAAGHRVAVADLVANPTIRGFHNALVGE